MTIIYKKVKKWMPHCSECKEELQGNGSIVLPYKCLCGQWEYDFSTSGYRIKRVSKNDSMS